MEEKQDIIIYKTQDGKTAVSLYAKDGSVWMNQQQMAELFDTSVPNISMHISNILDDNELNDKSVIKKYLTTATDGKNYLSGDEMDSLNRFVVVFLETAELRAKNRQNISMAFWRENVDKILQLNDRPLLTHKGSVGNAQMEKMIEQVYEQFDAKRKAEEARRADAEDLEEIKKLEQDIKNRKK